MAVLDDRHVLGSSTLSWSLISPRGIALASRHGIGRSSLLLERVSRAWMKPVHACLVECLHEEKRTSPKSRAKYQYSYLVEMRSGKPFLDDRAYLS